MKNTVWTALFVLILPLVLSACAAQPMTVAEAKSLSDHNLCTWRGYDPLVPLEVSARRLDCKKVVRDAVRQGVKTSDALELCKAWYDRSTGPNIDLVDREVEKRRLDCAAVVQRHEQLQAMRQHNAILAAPPSPRHTRCHTRGSRTYCDSY